MGLLLGLAISGEVDLPLELGRQAVSESEAASSGQARVLFCPRCHWRLCAAGRDGQAGGGRGGSFSPLVWRIPSSRVEKAWLGGSAAIRCRACSSGRLPVDVLPPSEGKFGGGATGSSARAHEEEEDGVDASTTRSVVLRSPAPRLPFRPFSVCVCGIYDSVVSRAAELLQTEEFSSSRALHVAQRVLRRSELSRPPADFLPAYPLELLIVAHRISGQRNPLTDAHGLYSALLTHAWEKAEVVLLLLFDLPCDAYLSQLLEEQPTLLSLLSSGRLLPLFTSTADNVHSEGVSPDADPSEATGSKARTDADATDALPWIKRCLDGRLPRVGSPPEATAASALPVAVEAAASGGPLGSTRSVLSSVAKTFKGKAFVKD